MRFIGLGVPEASWPTLLDEALRVLRSGGQLEIIDMSYELPTCPASFQESFASLLLADGVTESPARSINFVLPMLDNLHSSSIPPVIHERMVEPVGAFRDATPLWMSSALGYKSTYQPVSGTSIEACHSLGWHPDLAADGVHVVLVSAWVVLRK